jgi:hypothetical protein
MASRQPGAVLNLVLFCALGSAGWFAAVWTKPAKVEKAFTAEIIATGPASQAGVLASDGRQLISAAAPGAEEFDELVVRYGSGSEELSILAAGLLDKWATRDPAAASTEGLTRCLAHTPDLVPALFTRLSSAPALSTATLYAALPSGPLRHEALVALASARGSAGGDPGLADAGNLNRSERSLVLREWHRARALADTAAADASAAALTDADDREAAQAGILFARAAADPELTLRASLTRHDFSAIAAAAFTSWIPRDSPAAWAFAATLKGDPRLPGIAARMLTLESRRRRFSDAVSEMNSLLQRLFPNGLPTETLAVFLPSLAAENPAAAQKFADGLTGDSKAAAIVILFDAFCDLDPPSAWRLATGLAQKEATTDHRGTHTWKSALARARATPQERLAAGFPDLTDMINLAGLWLNVDPPAAITAFCSPTVPAPLQKLIIETAINQHATAIAPPQLIEWAKKTQPEHVLKVIESVTGPMPEEKKPDSPAPK